MTINDIVGAWASEQELDDLVDLDKLMRIIRNTYLTGFIEGVMVGDAGASLPSPDYVWATFEGRDLAELDPAPSGIIQPPKLVI